jgi:threonine dehydrogenase-like Zn-dependent dehydrogenase
MDQQVCQQPIHDRTSVAVTQQVKLIEHIGSHRPGPVPAAHLAQDEIQTFGGADQNFAVLRWRRVEEITGGQLADVVIDATGSPKSMSTCFDYAAFTGRVVYVGITTSDLTFPHAAVFHRRELTLLASRNAMPEDFDNIIELIRGGKINTGLWITHRIRFEDVPAEFGKFTDSALGAIKVIIEVN